MASLDTFSGTPSLSSFFFFLGSLDVKEDPIICSVGVFVEKLFPDPNPPVKADIQPCFTLRRAKTEETLILVNPVIWTRSFDPFRIIFNDIHVSLVEVNQAIL